MSWIEFQERAPEMASLGFERLNRKIAYLATIKKDGSPRLHPVVPFIHEGLLFIFTEPSSPKILDLRRDGRYALHCSVSFEIEPMIEFVVSGTAEVITDPFMRERAERYAASQEVTDRYAFFGFHVQSALMVEYDENDKPILRRWKREQASAGEVNGSR